MAFIAMFMFILIAGVVDLGGAYQHYIIVINASREGARMYSRLLCTTSTRAAVRQQVITAIIGEPKPESEADKSGNQLTLMAGNVTISPDPASACPVAGAEVNVTVQVEYESLMGAFWGATTFPIRARTSMMYYGTSE
jgi:Flp pilus assembly protein TadG